MAEGKNRGFIHARSVDGRHHPCRRYKVVAIPERKADTVVVAGGAVVGASVTTLAGQAVRAVRAVRGL